MITAETVAVKKSPMLIIYGKCLRFMCLPKRPSLTAMRTHVNSTGIIRQEIRAFSKKEALKNLKRMFCLGIVKIAKAIRANGRIIIRPMTTIGKMRLIFKKINASSSSALKISSKERSNDEKMKRFAKQMIISSHA